MKIITSERSDLFQGFNSFHLFTRAIAHCRRFCHNASSKNIIKLTGPLSDIEIKTARDCIIKNTQETAFATEINCLSRNQDIDRKSKLCNLSPFIDEGILKVGGRLSHSNLS